MPTLLSRSPRESRNAAIAASGVAIAHTGEVEAPGGLTHHEVFLRDWATGEETRITHADRSVNPHTTGTPGKLAPSADARVVAFVSDVPPLTSDHGDGGWPVAHEDVCLFDAAPGTTARRGADGTPDELLGDRVRLTEASLSGDGQRGAFPAANRLREDGAVSVHDRAKGEARKIGGGGLWMAVEIPMTADGEQVFRRQSGTDPLRCADVATGKTTALPVEVWSEKEGDDHRGGAHAVPANGRLVAFTTLDGSGTPQTPLHEQGTGEVTPVRAGLGAHGGVLDPTVSADGRFVLFGAQGLDLGGGHASGRLEIVAFDREAGEGRLLTAGGGTTGGPGSMVAAFSADGRGVMGAATERFAARDADEAGDLHAFADPSAEAPASAPPVAEDDRLTVDEDGSIALDLLANDLDPDGDHLVIVETEGPAVDAGSLWTDEAGALRYAPGWAPQALAPGEARTGWAGRAEQGVGEAPARQRAASSMEKKRRRPQTRRLVSHGHSRLPPMAARRLP